MSFRTLALAMSLLGASIYPVIGQDSESLIPLHDSAVLKRWQVGYNPMKRDGIKISERFASQGRCSLLLEAPAWKPGMPEWPLWQLKNTFPKDWSGYDRLLIDLVNPTNAVALLGIKTADSETAALPSGNWGGTKVTIPRRGHLRAVVPLSVLMKAMRKPKMDQNDISVLMLYASRPSSDIQLYISELRLLRAEEVLPTLSPEYTSQLVDLTITPALSTFKRYLEETKKAVTSISNKEVKVWASQRLSQLRSHLEKLEEEAKAPKIADTEITGLVTRLNRLSLEVQRLPSLASIRESADSTQRNYAAGWVSSMQKVIPQEVPLPLLSEGEGKLSLARNEHEGIQLVIVPIREELQNVRLKISPLTSAEGNQLPASFVKSHMVGYVRTSEVSYEVDYSGWWPDPLLDFISTTNIAPETAQSFWISLHAPKDQIPGIYRGSVTIHADNAPSSTHPLSIHVRDFVLSGVSPIPVTMPSYSLRYFKEFSTGHWDERKFGIADFQADYYISWDNLYDQRAPDWEVLSYLKQQGRLGKFNLHPLGFDRTTIVRAEAREGGLRGAIAAQVERIRPAYDEAKKRGLLEHAYLYGMDELPSELFPQLQVIAKGIKAAFPEVLLVTTAQDFTYGAESQIDEIDAWVPLIHEYDPEKADAARSRGKAVWWYNCKTPAHPYPNQFTEYPAIELRLMHGAMSAKYRPDGFLYYSLFRSWLQKGRPPRKAIEHGPYTDWEPCALAFSEYDIYNGEGYLAYPGPDGRPLSSIRLENFRDGFEDLAYWHLLKERIAAVRLRDPVPSSPQAIWLEEAEAAISVPTEIVKSAHEFTLIPDNVLNWRNRMADLIESTPLISTSQSERN